MVLQLEMRLELLLELPHGTIMFRTVFRAPLTLEWAKDVLVVLAATATSVRLRHKRPLMRTVCA